MFKKFLLVITTMVVLFTFVTYQPQKADAAVNVAVKVVAQQTLKAVTKSSVDKTVQKMLVNELLDEVKEKYAQKTGMKLIETGGQKMLVKSTYNETEKVVLKKKIDEVIDNKVYGNSPGWVKFVDWFIGVGTVVMIGQLLYATVTGEFSNFIGEIIMEALVSLGWASTAVPLNADGTVPNGDDPIRFPSDTPVTDYSATTVPTSNYYNFRDSTTGSSATFNRTISFPSRSYYDTVISYETMYDTVYSDTGFPVINYVASVSTYKRDHAKNYYPLSLDSLRQRKLYSPFPGANPLHHTTYIDVKYGDTKIVDGMNVTSMNNSSLVLPTSFVRYRYNKVVIQYPYYDFNARAVISRLYLISTHFKLPTLYAMTYMPFNGDTTYPDSNLAENRINSIRFDTGPTGVAPIINPINYRIGIHDSLQMALSDNQLPPPKMVGTSDVVVPLFNPSTGKIAFPQESILPSGYTYDPEQQEIINPEGSVVTNPDQLKLPNPDPVVKPQPDGTTEVDGVPTDTPVPPGGDTPPPTDGAGTGGSMETGDPSQIDWDKLKGVPMILTKKFPFSLPWDAQRFMQGVFGDIPSAEEFSVKIDDLMGIHFGLNITLPAYFDGWFDFARTATTILFDLGLIYALYRLLGGAS